MIGRWKKKLEWYLSECADSRAIKACPAIYVLEFKGIIKVSRRCWAAHTVPAQRLDAAAALERFCMDRPSLRGQLLPRAGVTWTLAQCKSRFIYLFISGSSLQNRTSQDRFAKYEWNISRIHVSLLLLNQTCMLTLCTVKALWRLDNIHLPEMYSILPSVQQKGSQQIVCCFHTDSPSCVFWSVLSFMATTVAWFASHLRNDCVSSEWCYVTKKHVFSFCVKSVQEARVHHVTCKCKKIKIAVLRNMLFSNTTLSECVGAFLKSLPLGIFSILYISILNLRTFKVNGNTPSDRQLSN